MFRKFFALAVAVSSMNIAVWASCPHTKPKDELCPGHNDSPCGGVANIPFTKVLVCNPLTYKEVHTKPFADQPNSGEDTRVITDTDANNKVACYTTGLCRLEVAVPPKKCVKFGLGASELVNPVKISDCP